MVEVDSDKWHDNDGDENRNSSFSVDFCDALARDFAHHFIANDFLLAHLLLEQMQLVAHFFQLGNIVEVCSVHILCVNEVNV